MYEKDDIESIGSDDSTNYEKTLTFEDEPSLNPQSWSPAWKVLILSINFALVVNSTSGTSLASGGIKGTLQNFGVENAYGWRVLPIFIYLVGASIGSVVLAPLSENFGRRPINLLSTLGYILGSVVCAAAPDWTVFNVARLVTGIFSAGPPGTAGG